MLLVFFTLICLSLSDDNPKKIYWPIKNNIRTQNTELKITKIGHFGLIRKPRPGIPEHYHTGIDIKRSNDNYEDEPIYPIAQGEVISKRDDGPFANVIIEHNFEGKKFWSVYEHISGIIVDLNGKVYPNQPIAHFMNQVELDRYGWQFDHFHLEILKVEPIKRNPDDIHPEQYFRSYTLQCFTEDDLHKYYYNPIEFLETYPELLIKTHDNQNYEK